MHSNHVVRIVDTYGLSFGFFQGRWPFVEGTFSCSMLVVRARLGRPDELSARVVVGIDVAAL